MVIFLIYFCVYDDNSNTNGKKPKCLSRQFIITYQHDVICTGNDNLNFAWTSPLHPTPPQKEPRTVSWLIQIFQTFPRLFRSDDNEQRGETVK